MTNTTEIIADIIKRVKIIAAQVIDVGDEALNIFANDAYSQALADGFKEPGVIVASSYLTAHYAYIAFNKNAKVKKEQAAVLSREYFDSTGTDDYLTEYQRLLNDLVNGTSGNIGGFW